MGFAHSGRNAGPPGAISMVSLRATAPILALLATACSGAFSNVASSVPPSAGALAMPQWAVKGLARAVCPVVVGKPTCLALIQIKGVSPNCVGAECGWAPADFRARYHLPTAQGAGQIVAIVDDYDQPNAASDLATYRKQFGLGKAHFVKYNAKGQQKNYPQNCGVSSGWCIEEDLDIEMVSATCPRCTIYLIEDDGSNPSTERAEKTAVSLGAHVVSNSWSCLLSNDCGDPSFPKYFDVPGVEFLASSGDYGYDFNGAPETLATVVSVGGTQLVKNRSGYHEIVWPDAGAGCSNNGIGEGVTKPSWQNDPSCSYRTDTDIAAEAGCSPGVSEYDSSEGGWFAECGTSASSPLIAGIFGLAGNARAQHAARRFWRTGEQHERQPALYYIRMGNDGNCAGSYLCNAGTQQFGNYGGPVGWGSPKGTGLF